MIQVPAVERQLPGRPEAAERSSERTPTAATSSVNGITLHVLGNAGVQPSRRRQRPGAVPPANPHALQNAIDGAAAGSLLVLSPGTYNENVIMWKPLILQGLGPGGIIGAHELQTRAPEDPRFNVPGSVIDGRFFRRTRPRGQPPRVAHAPLRRRRRDAPGPARRRHHRRWRQSTGRPTRTALGAARIDGIGPAPAAAARAPAASSCRPTPTTLQITNNVLESNGGSSPAAIGLGEPYATTATTTNVSRSLRNRVLGSGGLTRAGGIGDLLRLEQLRDREQHLLRELRRRVRRRHLPLGPQPRRRRSTTTRSTTTRRSTPAAASSISHEVPRRGGRAR